MTQYTANNRIRPRNPPLAGIHTERWEWREAANLGGRAHLSHRRRRRSAGSDVRENDGGIVIFEG